MFTPGDALDAEILSLRQQVLVLQRQIARPRFTNTDQTILALLHPSMDDRHRARNAFLIVKPETVLRWHRRLIARNSQHRGSNYDGSDCKRPPDGKRRGLSKRYGRRASKGSNKAAQH